MRRDPSSVVFEQTDHKSNLWISLELFTIFLFVFFLEAFTMRIGKMAAHA